MGTDELKRHLRAAAPVLGSCVIAACVSLVPQPQSVEPPTSTFDQLSNRADSGDVSSRVVVGYLLATGRGTRRDYSAARTAFELAADQGDEVARLNLAVLYYLGAGVTKDRALAESHFRLARASLRGPEFSDLTSLPTLIRASCGAEPDEPDEPDVGRDVFLLFCAGCHGSGGIAEYGLAPSFALGERMEKETDELLRTVLNGHGSMPRWDDKLPPEWLEEALEHARSLQADFRRGMLQAGDETPGLSFRFGPMSDLPTRDPPPEPPGASEPSLRDLCSLG
jgi:mono/diheme cytochrome c family protein